MRIHNQLFHGRAVAALSALVFVCGLARPAAAATLGGTNIWTGAGNDFKWSNDENWRAVNCAGVEISPSTFRNGTTPCVFDFSALPDGAAVTNDISGKLLFPMGFVFASDSAGKSWSLVADAGCNLVSRVGGVNHNCECVVPEGCTVNYGLRFGYNYSTEGDLIVTGGGTLNMNSAAYTPWRQKIVVKDSILRIDAAIVDPGISMCFLALEGDSAKLVLERNLTILGLMSQGSGTPTVELGAYTLKQTSGFDNSKFTYNGTVTGTGNFIVESGVLSTMSEPQTMTGLLELGNSDVTLVGDATLASASQAQFDYSGRLKLAQSQTLKSVVGEGVTGGVEVPQGATLTLTGEGGATGSFNGRFMGEGSVTVDAAGYAYELDGSSHHEAPLRVKAGKVTLASLPAGYSPTADDSEVYLSFDNGLTTDSSTNGYAYSADSGVVLTGGRAGWGADCNKGRVYGLAENVFGNVDQTISFWFNVPEFQSAINLFERSTWGRQIYIQLAADDKIYVRYNYQKNGADTFGGAVEYTATAPYAGSGWHHLVLTYAAHVPHSNGNYYGQLRLYVDGALKSSGLYNSGELQNAASDFLYFGSSAGRIQLDEIKFVGRKWSDSEVKAEYDRARGYFAGNVETMPDPVAHWAFDDAENPGKDSSGNGYDLTVPEKLVLYKTDGSAYDSGEVTAPVVETVAGAYGKAAKFSGNVNSGRALAYAGSTFPEKIPTGNHSFAISVRFQDLSQPGPTLVGWGDVTTAKANIRAAIGGSPSGVVCAGTSDGASNNTWQSVPGKGNFYATTKFTTGGNLGEGRNWSHAVFVWDGTKHEMRSYFDGHLYEAQTQFTPNAADLAIAAQNLIVGCNPKATTWGGKEERFFGGYIDDIQIFDCALTAEQVERLTRELNPETRGIGTAMSVDSGAELEVTGWTENPLASLDNSGTLTVDGSSRLSVSSGTIGGTVNGCGAIMADGGTVTFAPAGGAFTGVFAAKNGSLVVSSAAPSATVVLKDGGSVRGAALAADVTIPEGYTIMTDAAKKNLPIVATTGAVTVPTVAVWQIDATTDEIKALADTEFPLASGNLTLPADFSQWTCENDKLRIRYSTRAGAGGTTELYAKISAAQGFTIIVR